MKTLFLVVARGGSKSIKDKNLQTLGGLSLIGFKAAASRKSKYCSRLMISTDSEAIQEEARRHGLEVPFTRPAELAADDSSVLDTIRHAMDWVEERGDKYEALMLLEPSSPFTTAEDHDNAVEIMMRENANIVVGMRATEVNSVFVGPLDERGRITQIIDQISARRLLNRQEMRQEYTMNGCLYLMRWDYFRRSGIIYGDRDNSYGYVMDRLRSVEIDEPVDLHWSRFLVDQGLIDISPWRES